MVTIKEFLLVPVALPRENNQSAVVVEHDHKRTIWELSTGVVVDK